MKEFDKKTLFEEVDEQEMLNRLARERADRNAMVALEKAEHQRKQKKFDAVVRLVVNGALYLTTAAAFLTLGYLVSSMSGMFFGLAAGLAIAGAFRAGFIWHDVKKG